MKVERGETSEQTLDLKKWLLNNSSSRCKNAKTLTDGILRETQTNYYTYLRKLSE